MKKQPALVLSQPPKPSLLLQPLLPLLSIVQCIYLIGDFARIEEVCEQLPDEIETSYALYRDTASLLAPYLDLFRPLEDLKAGQPPTAQVIDLAGQPLDAMSATSSLVAQALLSRELEGINSQLCAPCGCALCCIGPTADMAQAYFEIPLQPSEIASFPLAQIDSQASRVCHAEDEPPLCVAGRDFFDRPDPVLIHWQSGWSLIVPRESRCPHLGGNGRCHIYLTRPQVCRRPQIFPYILEPVETTAVVEVADQQKTNQVFRLRQSLLAVVDCPYVQALQQEIAAYAAACELEMVFRHNKN
jgi:Fe-S-cluster containining protein